MEIETEEQENVEINKLLKRIKYKSKQYGGSAYFPVFIDDNKFGHKEEPLIQQLLKTSHTFFSYVK